MKHKRLILIAGAVVFLVVIFFLKTTTQYKNEANQEINQDRGLAYGNEIVADLVNKDTDQDGVLDWEEGLWGTDPMKRDTDEDGTRDDVEIENLKRQTGQGGGSNSSNPTLEDEKNLTETDKFSQELFSTVATLNQAGAMDQTTVDKISSSLALNIQNSVPRKVFRASDIKISSDTEQARQNYATTLGSLFAKNALTVSIPDILYESLTADGEVDAKALDKLDPAIKNIKAIVDGMAVMSVPSSLSVLHLNALNGFEKLAEDLSDIKLIDSDTVVAMSGISQYQEDDDDLKISIEKLIAALN